MCILRLFLTNFKIVFGNIISFIDLKLFRYPFSSFDLTKKMEGFFFFFILNNIQIFLKYSYFF